MDMTTVITHVWNEQHLLPSWLAWHTYLFDHVIVIDTGSTDSSRAICANIPGVTLIDHPMPDFDAAKMDAVVSWVESEWVTGWRIALNVTEFFLGDPSTVSKPSFIPSVSLINMADDPPFDWRQWFWDQRSFGIDWRDDFQLRRSRAFTFKPVEYTLGRHFNHVDANGFLICHVANCLVDEGMVERRLQIQHRIPPSDIAQNLGFQHHNWGRGLTCTDLVHQQEQFRHAAVDVSDQIKRALR